MTSVRLNSSSIIAINLVLHHQPSSPSYCGQLQPLIRRSDESFFHIFANRCMCSYLACSCQRWSEGELVCGRSLVQAAGWPSPGSGPSAHTRTISSSRELETSFVTVKFYITILLFLNDLYSSVICKCLHTNTHLYFYQDFNLNPAMFY